MDSLKLAQFRYIFYPRSVAVLGVSGNGDNAGTKFFNALLTAGFKGKVYAVNPTGGRIANHEIYRDVRLIPDDVDNAIVAVPSRAILDVVDGCIAKGIKALQVYTAGFSETGLSQNGELEKALIAKARLGGIRIVGPNCMGVYSPAEKLPYGMTSYIGDVGPISFLSQSGGLGGMVIDMGIPRGLRFSKLVSFGNGGDLDSVDYLEYFSEEPATKIIGAYLEGQRQGHRFLKLAKQIFHRKPLIVWRGGKTEAGAKAAASHTGSLAASDILWTSALRQAGAVRVENVEEMVDTLLVFQELGVWKGKGIAFVSGITGGGGGVGVTASDIFTGSGIALASLSSDTQKRLRSLLPPVGNIVHNPIDMGGGALPRDLFYECLLTILKDPAVDILIFHERTSNFLQQNYLSRVADVNEVLISLRKDQDKPIAVVSIPGTEEGGRLALEKKLEQNNIPVFPTLDRAALALRNLSSYWNRVSD